MQQKMYSRNNAIVNAGYFACILDLLFWAVALQFYPTSRHEKSHAAGQQRVEAKECRRHSVLGVQGLSGHAGTYCSMFAQLGVAPLMNV